MSLTDCINTARQRLLDGSLRNEQSVSQSSVLPILAALGWPGSNPKLVFPEYSVNGGRVDFALLTHGRPTVFVEVKQPGMAGRADRQLFQYAYHEGIQIAVLTDGKTWHIYGPGLRGTYDERKVYLLDLLGLDPEESADRFRRYLGRDVVDSEQAEDNVRNDYKLLREKRIARIEFEPAWASLAASPRLADLFSTEVKNKCGFQPETADVISFLASLQPDTGKLQIPTAQRTETAVLKANQRIPPAERKPQPPSHELKRTTAWSSGSWIGDGITLPEGTELRASVRGRNFEASVQRGLVVFDNRGYKTPSAAGKAANGYETNGWKLWEFKRPGDSGWLLLDRLRD